MESHAQRHSAERDTSHYLRLLSMALLSFLAMYWLMYAMVDRLQNVYNNLNQLYMAGLMTAPMVVLELLLMGKMYQNKTLNNLIIAASAALGILFWVLIRQQAGITDRQFLRSMLPHHAGAILMCEQRKAHDPQIQRLCGDIAVSQKSEIALMKSLLAAPDRGSSKASVDSD